MPKPPSVLEGVLAILDEGSVTGTNKYGLLFALIELVPEVEADGRISFDQLASKSLEIHWDHARPFRELVLRQVKAGNRENTTVVLAVQSLQKSLESEHRNCVFEIARRLTEPEIWEQAVQRVKKDLRRNPIKRLQNLPGDPPPFLYEIGRDGIQLLPGVADELRRFGPVLRTLIEAKFVEFVVDANRAGLGDPVDLQLKEHFFGAERHMPGPRLRHELWQLQAGRCLYSGAVLADPAASVAGQVALDHVVPWSRHRLSHLENLVLVTSSVNSQKRNLPLGPHMLQRWLAHLDTHRRALASIAHDHRWPTDPEQTLRVSRSMYGIATSVTVWDGLRAGITTEDAPPLAALHSEAIAKLRATRTETTQDR